MGERYKEFGTYGNEPRREEVTRPVQPMLTEEERRAQEMYKQNIGQLCELFKYRDDIQYTFGPRGIEVIESTFGLLRQQMDRRMLQQDTTVPCGQQCLDQVKDALNIIKHEVIYKPHTPILRDFGMEFARLALNWATLIAQRPDLINDAATIQRMIRSQLTLEDCIEIIKQLMDQSRKVLEYVPPGFNLSRHYEESLRKDTEK